MTACSNRKIFARYLVWLLLPALFMTALFSANYLFLKNAGEYEPVSRIVQRQLAQGGLYNSGVSNLTYRYKLALYHQVKPEIAVMGSSRAMQFQGYPFQAGFVNLGGATSSIAEARILARDMAARHTPEIIIVVIDYWWFNGAIEAPTSFPEHTMVRRRFLLSHLYKPFLWLADGRIQFGTYLELLGGPAKNIGAQAIVTFNLKDFPAGVLEPLGVMAQSPDDFLVHQYHLDPDLTVQKVTEQAQGVRRNPSDLANRLEPLARRFVDSLRTHAPTVFTPAAKERTPGR